MSQPSPSNVLQPDHLRLSCNKSHDQDIQKENEPINDSLHEISQVSTQAEEPSFPSLSSLPVQDQPDVIIPISFDDISPRASNQSNKFVIQASFLRKVCAVLVSFIVWAIFASNTTNIGKMLENLYVIIFCCFGYLTLENLFICVTVEGSQEHLFNIIDGLLVMYFICILNFPSEEETIRFLLVASPCLFLVSLCLYLWKSHAKKNEKIIIRLAYTIQSSLITAKFLGYVSFAWMETLIPLRVCLLSHQIFGLFKIFESFGKIFKQRNSSEINGLSLVKNLLKMSWDLLYYGLSSLALGLLLDLCLQVEREESIGVFSEIAQYYCSFFFGYTLIFFKLMKKLNINMNEENSEVQVLNDKEVNYSIKPQNKQEISHFKQISPTYFIKIDKEERSHKITSAGEIEETLCYICETTQPDIILMGCGHGGMCKGCLLASMKKNNKCLECRTPVNSIYQIKKGEEYANGTIEAHEAFCVIH